MIIIYEQKAERGLTRIQQNVTTLHPLLSCTPSRKTSANVLFRYVARVSTLFDTYVLPAFTGMHHHNNHNAESHTLHGCLLGGVELVLQPQKPSVAAAAVCQ